LVTTAVSPTMPGTPFNITDSCLLPPGPRWARTVRPPHAARATTCPQPALYGTTPTVPAAPDPEGAPGIPWSMPTDASPTAVSPVTARKTWRTVEPLHGMVYFAPEAADSYGALGLEGESGYFASRSAAMGPVTPGTVVATFFNFRPSLVHRSMDGVWETTTTAAVLEARVDAAASALRRMLGDTVDPDELATAAGLARRAAERAAEHPEGRPLFAAHAGLPWPEDPLEVLWHAQTLLREFRGDGHVAQLVGHGLDGVEALVMHEATGELPVAFLRATRGWDDGEWSAAADRLRARGWLRPQGTAEALALSDEGAAVRAEIEEATDRSSVVAYEAIGDEGCETLRGLARPWSRRVVAASGMGG
jgi:hypothetical protein